MIGSDHNNNKTSWLHNVRTEKEAKGLINSIITRKPTVKKETILQYLDMVIYTPNPKSDSVYSKIWRRH